LLNRDIRGQFFANSASANAFDGCCRVIITANRQANMSRIGQASMSDVNAIPNPTIDIAAKIDPGMTSQIRGFLSKK